MGWKRSHYMRYASIPAIPQITAHSLSLTGHTERRDWRKSENPESSGTPFISASETAGSCRSHQRVADLF